MYENRCKITQSGRLFEVDYWEIITSPADQNTLLSIYYHKVNITICQTFWRSVDCLQVCLMFKCVSYHCQYPSILSVVIKATYLKCYELTDHNFRRRMMTHLTQNLSLRLRTKMSYLLMMGAMLSHPQQEKAMQPNLRCLQSYRYSYRQRVVSVRSQTVAMEWASVSVLADIDWNCLLSKLLYFLMPISNS